MVTIIVFGDVVVVVMVVVVVVVACVAVVRVVQSITYDYRLVLLGSLNAISCNVCRLISLLLCCAYGLSLGLQAKGCRGSRRMQTPINLRKALQRYHGPYRGSHSETL